MADGDDRGGIRAIVTNHLLGDDRTHHRLVHARGETGLFDPFRQRIHPARKHHAGKAAEQVDARAPLGWRRCCGAFGRRDRFRRSRIERVTEGETGKKHRDQQSYDLGRLHSIAAYSAARISLSTCS